MPQNLVDDFESFVAASPAKPAGTKPAKAMPSLVDEFEAFSAKPLATPQSKAPAVLGFDEKHPVAAKTLDFLDKYLTAPLNSIRETGGKMGSLLAEHAVVRGAQAEVEDAARALRMQGREKEAAELLRVDPETTKFPNPEAVGVETFIRGVARDTGSIAGGFVADPTNWPFILSGAMAAPTLRAVADLGFSAMQGHGAFQELRQIDWSKPVEEIAMDPRMQSGAIQAAFAAIGMASAPANVKAALARRVADRLPSIEAPEIVQEPTMQVMGDALMSERAARAREIQGRVDGMVQAGRAEILPDGSVRIGPEGPELPVVPSRGSDEGRPAGETHASGQPVQPAGTVIDKFEVQNRLGKLDEAAYEELLDYIYPIGQRKLPPQLVGALTDGDIAGAAQYLLSIGDEVVTKALVPRELPIVPSQVTPAADKGFNARLLEEAALETLGAEKYAELQAAGASLEEIDAAIKAGRAARDAAVASARIQDPDARAAAAEAARQDVVQQERRKLTGQSPTGVERRGGATTPEIPAPPAPSRVETPAGTFDPLGEHAEPVGRETMIQLGEAGQHRARYKVVEADTLTPSHQAMTFSQNPNYPTGVQERRYDTDPSAQATTIRHSAEQKWDLFVNTDPSSLGGPPQALPDGTVLGGNGRTMALQRAYWENRGDSYRTYLKEHAAEFGIDPAQIDAMQKPVLIREILDAPTTPDEIRRLGRSMNQDLKKALPEFQQAVSAGKNISDTQIEEIATVIETMKESQTLREAMREAPEVFRRILLDSGTISTAEMPKYFDMDTGALNETGKLFVENALLGNVINDVDILESMPKGVRNKIERALPGLIELARRNDKWNIIPEIQEAVKEIVKANAMGLPLAQAFEQKRLGFEEDMRPKVLALGKILLGKATEASKKFKAFAAEARMDSPNNPAMFAPDFDASFRQIFEVPEGTALYFMGLDPAKVKAALTALFTTQKHPDADVQAVLDRVSTDAPKDRRINFAGFYRDVVDRLKPLQDAVRALTAASQRRMPTEHDAYELGRLNAGWVGKANQFITSNTFDPRTLDITGPGLEQRWAPVNGRMDELRAYLVAKRALEIDALNQQRLAADPNARMIETGVPIAEAQATVQKLGTPEMENVAGLTKMYQDDILEYLGQNFFRPEQLKALQQRYPAYVPFYRLMEPEAPVTSVYAKGKGRSFVDLWNPVRRMKGSERKIIDPLESIIKNTYTFINIAERNKVAKAFVDQAMSVPGQTLVERVKPPVTSIEFELREIRRSLQDAGVDIDDIDLDVLAKVFRTESKLMNMPNVISVMEGGVRRYYRVHPDIHRAMKALDKEPMNVLTKILNKPSSALRLGATTFSPEFLIRNPGRDTWTAFLQSRNGFLPVKDTVIGAFHVLGRTEMFREFERAGGMAASMVALDRKTLQHSLKEMQTNPIRWEVMHPIEAWRKLAEYGELATRMGEYRLGRKAGKSPATSALDARDVTLDFARMGARTQALNSIIAFWNAAVQSTDRFVRMHTDSPKTAFIKGSTALTLPSLMLYWLNKDDPDYQELPQWQKDFFWLVPTWSGDDKTKFIPIPKPFLWGMTYGTTAERVAEWVDTKDPKAFDEWASSLYQTAAPSFVPTAAAPVAEVWANKSMFTGRPVEPAQLQELPATERYQPWTSEYAKSVSKGLDQVGIEMSPMKVEQLTFGYSAGAGRLAVKVADPLFGPSEDQTGEKPSAHMADIPLLRAFAVRFPTSQSESVQEMYDRLGELEKKYAGFRYAEKFRGGAEPEQKLTPIENRQRNRLRSAAESISNLHAQIRKIQANKNFSGEKKREEIDKRMRTMIVKARDAIRDIGPRPELPEIPTQQPVEVSSPNMF